MDRARSLELDCFAIYVSASVLAVKLKGNYGQVVFIFAPSSEFHPQVQSFISPGSEAQDSLNENNFVKRKLVGRFGFQRRKLF